MGVEVRCSKAIWSIAHFRIHAQFAC